MLEREKFRIVKISIIKYSYGICKNLSIVGLQVCPNRTMKTEIQSTKNCFPA